MSTKQVFSSSPPKTANDRAKAAGEFFGGCLAAAVVILGRLLLLAVVLCAVTLGLTGAAGGMGHELSFGHTLLAVTSLWALIVYATAGRKR